MKYSLVKLEQLSGDMTSIYSLYINDDETTLFDNFLKENKDEYLKEIKDLLNRLKVIGYETGARDQYFKLNEGRLVMVFALCTILKKVI